MSHRGRAFQLGGVVVPVEAAMQLSQRIEPVDGGAGVLRLGRGAAVKQVAWEKQRVTLSGSGWAPPGLLGLDYAQPMLLRCGLPDVAEGIGDSNLIELPLARRTDAGYLPFARAHTAQGPVSAALEVVDDLAAVTPVEGAIAYTVWFFPEFTVYASRPGRTFTSDGAAASWELVCEEV